LDYYKQELEIMVVDMYEEAMKWKMMLKRGAVTSVFGAEI